jgi:hypothetical protein
MKWLIVVIILFSFSSAAQVQQQSEARPKKETPGAPSFLSDQQHSKMSAVFHRIEDGIHKSTVEEIEKDLAALVSIAIGTGQRGYFSKNQAVSILSGYFSGRRPVSFDFSRIHEQGTVPYATGRFVYVQKGNQESVQIYVSLTKQDSRWVISQFNIYE